MANPSGSWSSFRNAGHGPWLVGSTIYALTVTTNTVTMHRSTDGGGSWSTSTQSLTGVVSASGAVSSTTIHVATMTGSAAARYTYDTTSHTWTSVASTAAVVAGTGVVHADVAPYSSGQAMIYQSATSTVMGTPYRRVSVIGTGVSATVLPANDQVDYDAFAAIAGAGGRVHLFYTALSGSTRTLRHRTLTSAGSLITEQSIASITNTTYPVGRPSFDGTTVKIPFVSTTGSGFLSAFTATSADSPSWSSQGLSPFGNATDAPESVNSNPGAITHDGTEFHAFWPVAAQDRILQDVTASGFWQATDVVFASGIGPVNGISIGHVGSGAIGILYDNNGTVTYGDYGAAPGVLTLTGSSAASSTAAATGPNSGKTLTGTVPASSSSAGTVAKAATLTGSVTASSAAAGSATAVRALTGTVAGDSAAAGTTTLAATLTGTSAGNSLAAGDAETAGGLDLDGTSTGSSAAAGTVTVASSLAGSVAGTSDATGTADVAASLTGTVAGSSLAEGDATATGQDESSGSAVGSSDAAGEASITYAIAGAAAGTSAASGDTTITIVLTGSAAGASACAGATLFAGSLVGYTAGTSDAVGLLQISSGGLTGFDTFTVTPLSRTFTFTVPAKTFVAERLPAAFAVTPQGTDHVVTVQAKTFAVTAPATTFSAED